MGVINLFRFIHAADIHLDSPLVGLSQYDGAPVDEIRGATRKALENLTDLAIAEEVAFVVIAGDLYDGDWKDYNTGLFFALQMTQLREHGIRVYIVYGNHDAASQITKELDLPTNVTAFPSNKAKTALLEDIGVAIHGRSFASRKVTDDVSGRFPDPVSGMFNIGLLHTSANGREGHEPYAPCTVKGLVSKGYAYWALGHVHGREVLNEDPWIVFPGNIQGRHIRETGPKGCTLVTVEDNEVASIEHRDLDMLRWALCEVDATDAEDGDDVVACVQNRISAEIAELERNLLAVRIELTGACKAHEELLSNPDRWINQIRQSATDISGGLVWIQKVKIKTRPKADLQQLLGRDDPLGRVVRAVTNMETGGEMELDLAAEFSDLLVKLPPEAREGDDAIDLKSPATTSEILGDVKQLLITALLETGGEK